MLRSFFLSSVVLFTISVHAQNFNYSLANSSSVYEPLAGATVLTIQEDWANKKFNLKLPFQFNCAGTISDSLTIENHGFISFGKNDNLALASFTNFTSNIDNSENFVSSINTVSSGTAGNRIVKIEFKNLSVNLFSEGDFLNYQIWLYETSNKIEFHIGSNSYSLRSDVTELNDSICFPQLIGLINRRMDTETKAFLASGSNKKPKGAPLTKFELVYIENIPFKDKVFTFTPLFN